MPTIKLHDNGKVITKSGKVSCMCCSALCSDQQELADCYEIFYLEPFVAAWSATVYRVSPGVWEGYADTPECGSGFVELSTSGTAPGCQWCLSYGFLTDDGEDPPNIICERISRCALGALPEAVDIQYATITVCEED